MYPVDIGGRMKVPGKGMSPLSDVDIISTTNSIYVNESGDSMKGPLDMKNNKIVNLPNPNRNNDASNKFYVDDSIANATKKFGVLIKELDKLNRENIELKRSLETAHNNLERLASSTNQLGLDIAAGVAKEVKTHDEHFAKVEKVIQTQKESQDDAIKKLETKHGDIFVALKEIEVLRNKIDRYTNYKLYSAILDIGTNTGSNTEKNTVYDFTFPYKLLLERIHLQLTMNEQTIYMTQHINCIIKRIDLLNENTLRVAVMTYRTNPGHQQWGIHVQAYLAIMVYDTVPKTTLTLDYPAISNPDSNTTFVS